MPIEADLPQSLSADHLNVDSVFVLKVLAPWRHGDCNLVPGTLLHATVRKAARDNRGHTGELAFTLTGPCGDKEPLPMIVASLLAPPVIQASQQIPSFFGGLNGKEGTPQSGTQGFTNSTLSKGESQVPHSIVVHVNKLPKTIGAGEVFHLPHIQLVLPPAGDTRSTLVSTSGSLHLPEYTIFILKILKVAGDSEPRIEAVPVPAARSLPEARRAIEPFIKTCHSGRCSSFSDTFAVSTLGSPRLTADQDLGDFGFKPEHDHDVAQLGLGTTVHFLTDREVVVTFPTHGLVRRSGGERPTDNPQPVRAVLFDTATHTVERTEDWTIDDHDIYLWRVGGNLLIHDGHELRLCGPGLQVLATLPLDLPLASVRVSPDGEHLLLGEIHELHSAEDHRLFRQTNTRPPQEEVFWSLLDNHLHRIRTLGTSTSYVPPPTLLNGGMIELRRGRDPEWFLAGGNWDSKGDTLLGSLRSSCLPVLDNLAPNLLTISTCDNLAIGMHTYLLREDGAPVAEQNSAPQDLPISFAAASAAPRVALLRTRANGNYTRGLAFNLGTLTSQFIEVLGTQGGALVARVPIPEIAPYRTAFALSPDGGTLALLSGKRLLSYALPP